MSIVVDAHQDIAYNSLKYGRDYRRSALVARTHEPAGTPSATIGLPESIAGRVAVICATLFVAPAESDWTPTGNEKTYSNPQEAYTYASEQLDYYDRLADESDRITVVKTAADLDSVVATWSADTPVHLRKQGLVVLMEGADPIVEPRQFEEWYARGVRIVGTAWQRTRYSGGTGAPGGLTALGRELLDVMASFGALLDVSHMAEKSFYEACDHYEGPIFASHSNPRKFCETDRHLSDDMIRILAERDGVMGTVLYNRFLSNTWKRGNPKGDITLKVVADVIDHVCQVTGSAAHVGIGSDFDGGFGSEMIPLELDTVGDLLVIGKVLRERGFSDADVDAVLSGNMLRKIRAALPG
ncbi:MAG: membrane dipeptidase [Anaerolineae bacterium]|nr:membrane dipeptidase [Anaerolineae bacterium]